MVVSKVFALESLPLAGAGAADKCKSPGYQVASHGSWAEGRRKVCNWTAGKRGEERHSAGTEGISAHRTNTSFVKVSEQRKVSTQVPLKFCQRHSMQDPMPNAFEKGINSLGP
jgi:hypothetical protein